MRPGKMAVFGVPHAAGAARGGLERGPLVLRQAGLLERLRATGATVVNLSDLSLFGYADDRAHPRARNADLVSCAIATTADEMTRALREGFTIVLGGGCTLSTAMAAGARRTLGVPVGAVWIDGDAELNTPETTLSGLLDGMALALALGHGDASVLAAMDGGFVRAEHAALVGYTALDPGERGALDALALALPAFAGTQLGPDRVARLTLDSIANEGNSGPIVVHVDVTRRPAGLAPGFVRDLLARLVASPRVVAMSVCGFDPSADADGTHAVEVVDLIEAAVRARLSAG
jgi:arginase